MKMRPCPCSEVYERLLRILNLHKIVHMDKKKWWPWLLLALLTVIFFSIALIFSLNRNAPAGRPMDINNTFLFLIVSLITVFWGGTMIYRTQEKYARHYFCLIIVSLLMLVITGFIKRLAYSETFSRYLWYFSYFFLLTLPTYWVCLIIRSLTKTPDKIIKFSLLLIDLILFVLVMFNDLNNLTFIFSTNTGRYKHGVVYFIIYGYIFLQLISAMFLFSHATIKRNSFKQMWPIWLVLILMIIYSIFYIIPGSFISKTQLLRTYYFVYSFFSLLLIEMTLETGLIQNTGFYKKYFEKSSYCLALLDKNYKPIYANDRFQMVEQIKSENNTVVNFNRYRKENMADGYLIIQEDLTTLLTLQKELKNKQEELKRTTAILKKNQTVDLKIEKIKTQEKLFKAIDEEIAQKNHEIQEIVDSLPDELNEQNRKTYLPLLADLKIQICFLKQRCLFLINGSKNGRLTHDEFALSMGSLLQDLRSLDYQVACSYKDERGGKLSFCLKANDFFYTLVKSFHGKQGAIFLSLALGKEQAKARIFPAKIFKLIPNSLKLSKAEEDGDLIITMSKKK